jgi:hypothetical protein
MTNTSFHEKGSTICSLFMEMGLELNRVALTLPHLSGMELSNLLLCVWSQSQQVTEISENHAA